MKNEYKFKQQIIRMRWVDYQRIRAVFPAQREETMQSYFRRFALWLQLNYGKWKNDRNR